MRGHPVTGATFAWALSLSAFALASWAATGPARAADEPVDEAVTKVTEFEARVARHTTEKAIAALVVDAEEAVNLHKEVAEKPPLKKRVLELFRDLLRAVKEDQDKASVLGSLSNTADPDAAALVKPFLRQPNVEAADALLLAAIKAAGKVPAKDTVQPLLLICEKSKHMGAAVAAMEALGSFGKIKPHRERILDTLIGIVQPLQPGGRPGARGGEGGVSDNPDPPPSGPGQAGSPANRWAALSPELPKALNALTGQSFVSAEQWFQVAKEAKPHFGTLFKNP